MYYLVKILISDTVQYKMAAKWYEQEHRRLLQLFEEVQTDLEDGDSDAGQRRTHGWIKGIYPFKEVPSGSETYRGQSCKKNK